MMEGGMTGLPMNETQLMHSFDGEGKLSHVKSGYVLRENVILDKHGHEITTRQELHQHVQESGILERRVKFDHPRTI